MGGDPRTETIRQVPGSTTPWAVGPLIDIRSSLIGSDRSGIGYVPTSWSSEMPGATDVRMPMLPCQNGVVEVAEPLAVGGNDRVVRASPRSVREMAAGDATDADR